jgi:uncharacterized protein (TIGR03000 family)
MRSLSLSIVLALGILSLSTGRLPAAPEAAPATVRVTLPADATLTIDGRATHSTSAERLFVSPPIEPGKSYHYTFRAEFVRGRKTITLEQNVVVRAGRETDVSLGLAGEATGVSAPGRYAYQYGASTPDTGAYYAAPPSASRQVAPRGRPLRPFPFWGTSPSDPFYFDRNW